MNKIVLAALSGVAMLASAGTASAQTQTATAPSGFTLDVVAQCTLTAGVVSLGRFVAGDTVEAYITRFGWTNASGVFQSQGNQAPVQLASVTCPTGISWQLTITGSRADGNIPVLAPNGTPVFTALTGSRSLSGDGSTTNVNTMNGSQGRGFLPGTGTGAAQVVTGQYYAFNPTAAERATAFVAGRYTGTATATLTY